MSEHVKDRVLELFNEEHFYCAETVFTLIGEMGGQDVGDLVRLATGFCSGQSRTCGQCGAVSGAIMGIGLFAGRTQPGGDYDACYSLVQEFMDCFKEKCGSENCFELIGCDFATEEGQTRFKEKGLKRKCALYCMFAVETAVSLLAEHGYIKAIDS